MELSHTSVLLKESIELLNIKKNGIYVDCTLGRAGHSSEILKKLENGFLYAIDQDEEAIKESYKKLSNISSNFKILNGNFINLKSMLTLNDVDNVDGILYDLGVSSPQFDDPKRGFSYRFDATLDMRMDLSLKKDAKYIVNNYSSESLANLFWRNSGEKFSRRIANNIVEFRKTKELVTTFELVEIIKQSIPQKFLKQKGHPAKKVFQALRIEVNNELKSLEDSLKQAVTLLKKDSTLVVITFHSLEENIVKKIFKELVTSEEEKFLNKLPIPNLFKKDFHLITKKPILPNELELNLNNRSHSAKLWALRKAS